MQFDLSWMKGSSSLMTVRFSSLGAARAQAFGMFGAVRAGLGADRVEIRNDVGVLVFFYPHDGGAA